MTWKTAGIICGIIVFLALIGGVTYKITQPGESYKTRGDSIYFTNEPHQTVGCASFNIPKGIEAIQSIPTPKKSVVPVKK